MKSFKMILAALGCAGVLFVTGCSSTESGRSTGEVIDDTAIHTKVKAALVNDPVVSGTAINVDVDRGVVTLGGAVNGDVEKRKAEEIVRGVNGVRSVQNNIVVRQ
jgi:hyperosmotically inducible periplasmic protein